MGYAAADNSCPNGSPLTSNAARTASALRIIPQEAKSAAARRCSQGSPLPVRLSGEASSRRRLPQFENLASGAVNTPGAYFAARLEGGGRTINPVSRVFRSAFHGFTRYRTALSSPFFFFCTTFLHTSPFTPKSGLSCSVKLCIDDHGSLVIFRSASVRPKHLFDPYFDHDY